MLRSVALGHEEVLQGTLSYFYTQVPAAGSSFYRPLYHLWLAFDLQIWGVNPLGHTLNNVLLHAGSAALVALITLELSGRRWAGLLAGLLFALYPTHPFSMNYVMDLPNVLATALYLLALLAYLRYSNGRGRGYLLLSLVAFLLALMSKEIAASLPVVALLYELHRRTPWRALLLPMGAFAAVGAAYFALRYLAIGQLLGGYEGMPRDPAAILPTLARYLGLMLAPYSPNLLGGDYTPLYLATLGAAVLLVVLLASRVEVRALALFAAAFLATFLPIVPLFMGHTRGPAYGRLEQTQHVYLPSAFLCVGLALLVSSLDLRKVRWAVAAALVAFCAVVQPINNHPWLVASDLVRSAQQHPERLPVSLHKGTFVFPYFLKLDVYQGYEEAMSPWFRGGPPPADSWRDWPTAEGTVVAVDRGSSVLKLRTAQGPRTFAFDREDLQVRLLGNRAGMGQVKRGHNAEVGFTERDGERVARYVEIYRGRQVPAVARR